MSRKNGEQMTGTPTRGWPHLAGRPADDLTALVAGNPATAGPGALTRGTAVVFYGRTAPRAGTRDSRADRHRQLALCRRFIAAHGGRVIAEYFDEGCRADRLWNRRPQGQALLAELSGPARAAGALVVADPSCLLPRRPPAGSTPILQQLAFREVLLMLADTGILIRTAGEYHLLGELLSGPAGTVPASGLTTPASARDRQAYGPRRNGRAGRQPRGGEPG
jgi:hypothetical protein